MMRSYVLIPLFWVAFLPLWAQIDLPAFDFKPKYLGPSGYMEMPMEERWTLEAGNQKLTFGDGSSLWLPQGALLQANGSVYEGPVKVQFRKIQSPMEMFVSEIPMSYSLEGKAGVLESGGMAEIRVFAKDGRPLFPNPAAPPELTLKTNALPEADDMRQYRLIDSTGVWEETAPSVKTVRDSFLLMPRTLSIYRNSPIPFLGLFFEKRDERIKRVWPADLSPKQALVSIKGLTSEARFAVSPYFEKVVVLNYTRKELSKQIKSFRKFYRGKAHYPSYRYWVGYVSEISFFVRLEFSGDEVLELELMPLGNAAQKVEAMFRTLDRKEALSKRKGIGQPQGNYYYRHVVDKANKDLHFREDSVLFSNSGYISRRVYLDSTIMDTIWFVRNGQQTADIFQVFRTMPLNGFGVVNCDRPILFPNEWKPEVLAIASNQKRFEPANLYMAAKGVNTLFLYPNTRGIQELGLYKHKKQVFFGYQPDGSLGFCFLDPSVYVGNYPYKMVFKFQTVKPSQLKEILEMREENLAMNKP